MFEDLDSLRKEVTSLESEKKKMLEYESLKAKKAKLTKEKQEYAYGQTKQGKIFNKIKKAGSALAGGLGRLAANAQAEDRAKASGKYKPIRNAYGEIIG